ncbi:MAG: GNAT family N-acetyltransferase [Anaerolineaceae bacterium]|nr:GNAT family N-acetyltransferase [Anaerolineaceae bacterium]
MQITINQFNSSSEYRAQLNDLLNEAFNLSLERWFSSWGWPVDYTCFSLIEDDHILANASVYRMDLLINGAEQEWLQLGGVATRKERRGEGLSRKLLEAVLAHYLEKPFFLCANEHVLDFYPRFGFQRIPSWQPVLETRRLPVRLGQMHGEMRQMQLSNPRVKEYLTGRRCFSGFFDCTNAVPINWFYLLEEYAGCIYEIPAMQTLLVAKQKGSTLNLLGVWPRQPLTFRELAPVLGFSGVNAIHFGFQPDWLEVDYQMVEREDDPLFVRGKWPAGQKIILPDLIRT